MKRVDLPTFGRPIMPAFSMSLVYHRPVRGGSKNAGAAETAPGCVELLVDFDHVPVAKRFGFVHLLAVKPAVAPEPGVTHLVGQITVDLPG